MRTLLTFMVYSVLLAIGAIAPAQTPGEFEVRFDDSNLTTQQRTDLASALAETKMFWESVIIGYQSGVVLDGVDIVVEAAAIDGPNNILAQAGPGGFANNQAGFVFVTDFGANSSRGVVTIDTADFSTSLIVDVLKHEVGHVLGFGTLFNSNNLSPNRGEYIGGAGLTAYQAEFDSSATFVPLQNETLPGGIMVFNGHLDEDNPLSDAFGREARGELMTPAISSIRNSIDPSSNFLSNTSLAILRDLGYDTIETTHVVPDYLLGDCNLDGIVDFSDIAAFIAILQVGSFLEEADCNEDGAVTFADIPRFIAILVGL